MISGDDNPTATHAQTGARRHACPACGAVARRASARYCATCGRGLGERDYRPAESLRASYRWQRPGPPAPSINSHAPRRDSPAPPSRDSLVSPSRDSLSPRRAAVSRPREVRRTFGASCSREAFGTREAFGAWEVSRAREARRAAPSLFGRTRAGRGDAARRNAETERAYALLAYALCSPFLGVLLCPWAIACGAAGLRRARRERHPAAAREAERSVVYGILLFGAQALLWELVFLAPGWMG
jgi:hypothetical protein